MAEILHPANNMNNPNYMDIFRRNVHLTDPDAKKIDSVSTGLTYIGYALPGTLETEPYWLVKKITVVGTVTTIDYSNTSKMFTDIWNNRTGLTYY